MKICMIQLHPTHTFEGGGYHNWGFLCALADLGHEVTLITTKKAVYHNVNYGNVRVPEIREIGNSLELDMRKGEFDAFIGTISSASLTRELGLKMNVPYYQIIWDSFPFIMTLDEKVIDEMYGGREQFYEELKRQKVAYGDGNLFLSTKTAVDETVKLFGNKNVHLLPPSINDYIADTVPTQKRTEDIIAISRNSPLTTHKHWDYVFYAVGKLKNWNGTLNIITDRLDGLFNFDQLSDEFGVENYRIHLNVSDEEKFKMMKASKLMISGSVFEGFGMWLAEALYCGVPCVCFDYPTFREIGDGDHGIYFAQYDDKDSLASVLQFAIENPKIYEKKAVETKVRRQEFTFRATKDRLRNIFGECLIQPYKLYIGTPYYGDVDMQFIDGVLRLLEESSVPMSRENWITIGKRPHALARNMIAERFMKATKDPNDRLLFLDSDALCSPEVLRRLIEIDLDIVSAVAVATTPPYEAILGRFDEAVKQDDGTYTREYRKMKYPDEWDFNQVVEVDGVGMHCTLIKRRVFERTPQPWFEFKYDHDLKRFLGEDYYFIREAQRQGFKAYVDTSLISPHIGKIAFRLDAGDEEGIIREGEDHGKGQ